MLVLDGQLIICIEAKFGSGNTLAHEGGVKDGHKPGDRKGLLRRYLDPAPPETRRIIRSNGIGEMFHSQLFRNIIFASSMAKGCDWHVVNLVSDTQWKSGKSSKQYSFVNPEGSVRTYLHPDRQSSFTFRTWEALHGALIKGESDLSQLDAYFCSKSAHYRRAFDPT